MVLSEFFIYFFIYFLFFRRQGFRMITFDRQAGLLQNLNRSQVMVIGRSVSFSDPGCGRGAPQTPQTPQNPPPPQKKIVHAFQNTRNIFEEKQFVGKNFFLRFKTPGRCFARIFFSVTKNFHPQPHAPAQPSEHSPQSWCNNKCSNNCCVRYGLQPPTHLINTQCQQCLCTHRPACLSMII